MNAAAVQKQARPLPRQAVLVLERAGPPPERTGPPPDEPALQSVQNKQRRKCQARPYNMRGCCVAPYYTVLQHRVRMRRSS